MAVVWTITGVSADSLGLQNLRLKLVNLGMDVLTFDQPGAFDGAAAFAAGATVTLELNIDGAGAVTKFRGKVRTLPRRSAVREERIGFEVHGAWDELQRYTFLQNFKEPVTPSNPSSTLTDKQRGRVVLNQDDAGTRINIGAFIQDVIEFAAASGANVAVGDIDLNIEVAWDETTDLQCGDTILRALAMAPSAVAWWDYSVNPPQFNLQRRELGLSAINFAVQPEGAVDNEAIYAPLESVLINPRYDLLTANVCLIYIRTNRENESTWETTERDVYPPGTTGREENALVRTIQLAGSVYNSTVLTQKVEIEAIPSALSFSGYLTAGGDLTTVTNWWKKKVPWLKATNVTILGFRNGARTKEDGTAVTAACVNELVKGAITDWMEDNQGVDTEQQRVLVEVMCEVTDPVTAKKERIIEQLEATIIGTSAVTRTYNLLAEDSFTPEEEAPTGLAQALHAALSVLHYDGTGQVIQKEVTLLAGLGQILNLTGSLAAWSIMNALIQQVEVDLDSGLTSLTVGPPKHLGPADLIDIYRQNRNRQPVTSHLVRTTGRTGGSGGATRQGLSLYHPHKPGQASLPTRPRVYQATITVAGTVPTAAEMVTAIEGNYTSSNEPVAGDVINLLVSGVIKFRAVITATNPGGTGGLFALTLTIATRTYYAQVQQTGLY